MARRADEFEFFANHVALDFVNTVDNRLRPEPDEDRIVGFDDFLRWLVAAGVLGEAERAAVGQECAALGDACSKALGEARKLREAFREIFGAIAAGERPPEGAVDELNHILSLGPLARRVRIEEDNRPVSEWVRKSNAPMALVVALAEAGADLLASGRLDRVRACAGDRCGDLFYDTSKSGRRRWCNMNKCGNRTKVGRYRRRHTA